MGDFQTIVFPRVDASSGQGEGLRKEALDVMGLELAGFHPFHLLFDGIHILDGHDFLRQRMCFEQIDKVLGVQRGIDYLEKFLTVLGVVAVADGFDKDILQRLVVERNFAQYVEDLASQTLALGLQLVEEFLENFTFTGVFGDEVPQVAYFRLTDAVDAAEPLLDPVGIPRQVVVDHQVCPLEVDAFSCGIRRHKDGGFLVLLEELLDVLAVIPFHATHDGHHCFGVAKQGTDAAGQIAQGVLVFGEDDDLFPLAILVPHGL